MIRKHTVFVIGAGSGFDIEMPLGVQLAESISRSTDIKTSQHGAIMDGDAEFIEIIKQIALTQGGNNWGSHVISFARTCRQISDGISLTNSIDDYVNIHQDNVDLVLCAKAAISHNILRAERRSKLYANLHKGDEIKFSNLREIWYADLFKAISHGVSLKNIGDLFANITFINFNYDRCLEHYLIGAIKRLYMCEHKYATELVAMAQVFHPYGQIGHLPGMPHGTLQEVRFGGDDYNKIQSLSASKSILTYTEQVRDAAMVDAMKHSIAISKQIVFLGFGFHQQNMTLLQPNENIQIEAKNIYATAIGISDDNLDHITGDLAAITGKGGTSERNVRLEVGSTCSRLLRDYDRSIQSV